MIRSMTGFGRAQQTLGGRDITVELRAVNHRYFEFSARTPRAYSYLDNRLKTLVQQDISRGKVDCGVTIVTVEGGTQEVIINHELAAEYVRVLRGVGEELGLADDLTVSRLARLPDLFVTRKAPEDEEAIWADVKTVAEEAVARFLAMREKEGAKMKEDILGRLELIEKDVALVEEYSPRTVEQYRARLTAKLNELLEGHTTDENRIITEAAIVAERLAVDEETVRLRSHIAQVRTVLDSGEPIGRRLDFLVQEMNREANTIGSKCQDASITRIVVEIKCEIEKIREQIQNIE